MYVSIEDMEVDTAVVPMIAASLIMLVVGLFACLVPARRALQVQPTEALKSAQ
jgi:ABC-type antimicrobial peptide transport system permease subunit